MQEIEPVYPKQLVLFERNRVGQQRWLCDEAVLVCTEGHTRLETQGTLILDIVGKGDRSLSRCDTFAFIGSGCSPSSNCDFEFCSNLFTFLEDPIDVSVSLHDVDCVFKYPRADTTRPSLLPGLIQFNVDIFWLFERPSGDNLRGLFSRDTWNAARGAVQQ